MGKKPLVLLVNDDGVYAEGIRVLRDHFSQIADVYICAPHIERSAASHAITIHNPLRVEQLEDKVFAVEGYPADCVKLALGHLLPFRPDFIVSGINRGPNLGFDTLYSGTVSAALEGALFGIPGIAVSSTGHNRSKMYYDSAAEVAVNVFKELGARLEVGSIYNINVPSCPYQDLKGIKATSLGRRIDDDNIIESLDPRSKPYYWLGGGYGPVMEIDGSDCVEIKKGFATLSVLSPSLLNKNLTDKISSEISDFSDRIILA